MKRETRGKPWRAWMVDYGGHLGCRLYPTKAAAMCWALGPPDKVVRVELRQLPAKKSKGKP